MRWFSLLLLLASAVPAVAQQNLPPLPQPRLQTVFPAGARAGTSVEVTFTGTDMDEPQGLIFSHPGLKAEPIQPPAPPPPDPKKPAPKPAMGKAVPVVSKFKVAIAPNVPVGSHDVRFVNKWGVSNPRAFLIGDKTEIEEKEPNNDVATAQKVEINATINGIINSPTDVDYYTFAGKKGQRVLLHVAASSIDSKAKPAVELYDAEGNRLVFNRNYSGHDALADVTLPADGDYWIRLYEFTHVAGGPDYFYRLTISTGPWIDAVVPPMVEPGKTATVAVYGRNLPGGQPDPTAVCDGRILDKVTATITAPADPTAQQRLAYSGLIDPAASSLDGFEYRIHGAAGMSNPYLLMFARGPVLLEKEPNDRPEAAQVLPGLCEVAGHIDHRNDRDWFQFPAKKGEVYTIEVFGDRIGSPADFYFLIKTADPKAGPLGENDDNAELLHPTQFYTRHSDPAPFRLEVKADGQFLIMVGSRDAGTEYGPRHLYRLRITPEKPDFRLIVMPSTSNRAEGTVAHTDGNQSFDVFVWRQEGFNGAIDLAAEGLPSGATCPPQRIGPGQKMAALVVSAAASAAPAVAAITVKGSAVINGQPVVREARPASITWSVQPGQNIPTLSRLDRQLVLAIRDKAPYRVVPKEASLVVKQGDKAALNFQLARLWPDFKAPIAIQTVTVINNQGAIPGVTFNNNQPLTVAPDKAEGGGQISVSNQAVPGVYSLVFRCSAAYQYEKVAKGQKVNTGLMQVSLPVTLTVVPTSLGTLQVSMATPNLKPGAAGEMKVRVARLHGYTGEYKLKLILPPGAKGLTAADTVIPAGQDEVVLKVQAAADAKPGTNIPNLVVQAVAQFDAKTPITQEAKFNGINIVK